MRWFTTIRTRSGSMCWARMSESGAARDFFAFFIINFHVSFRGTVPCCHHPRIGPIMNSSKSDLMSIGSHCMHPDCRQKDFLPFTCDCCHQVFCLDHRSYASHECAQARGKECVVVVCPLCKQSIHLTGQDDVHEAFERHCRSGSCDPANYDRAKNKPRCPVARCKAKLTEATTYTCNECGTQVCMAHRFGSDHGCKGAGPQLQLPRTCPLAQLIASTRKRLHT